MINNTDTHIEEVEIQSEYIKRAEAIKHYELMAENIENFNNNNEIYNDIQKRLSQEYNKAFNEIIILSRDGKRNEATHKLGFIDGIGMAMNMLSIIEGDIKRNIEALYEEVEV